MTTTTEAPTTGVKVGDLFSSSWGYDQTNVSYWKVVGITPSGKSIRVQKCSTAIVSDGGPGGDRVVAGEVTKGAWVRKDGYSTYDPEAEPPVELKRLRSWTDRDGKTTYSFNWSTFADAYLDDGTPKYQTNPLYGH